MQIKRIMCPNCRAVLDVKNSQNEALKRITCLSCKTVLQVRFQPQQEPVDADTFYEKPHGPVVDDGATQFFNGTEGATQFVPREPKSISHIHLSYAGKTYPLKEGKNIVGRKGETSKATVQIETADRYMSRQHCSITVSTLPDGTKKAVLSNYQNKNLTTIDGQPIETGDSIRLTDGNAITMGHTTVTFKLS